MFLCKNSNRNLLWKLAEKFSLKVVISDEIDNIFHLPEQYLLAYKALKLLIDSLQKETFQVCTVAQLRFILMLQEVENRDNLIMPEQKWLHMMKKRNRSIVRRCIGILSMDIR